MSVALLYLSPPKGQDAKAKKVRIKKVTGFALSPRMWEKCSIYFTLRGEKSLTHRGKRSDLSVTKRSVVVQSYLPSGQFAFPLLQSVGRFLVGLLSRPVKAGSIFTVGHSESTYITTILRAENVASRRILWPLFDCNSAFTEL